MYWQDEHAKVLRAFAFMPGHCRRVLRKALASKQYFPDMSWDFRHQYRPHAIAGAHIVSLTLPDNSEHHIAFLVSTKNECNEDIRPFLRFVFDQFPEPAYRTVCSHFVDQKFRCQLHAFFEHQRTLAGDPSPYWDYGAKLIYDLNHVRDNLRKPRSGVKKDWDFFYECYNHSRLNESNVKWSKISDRGKHWLASLDPPIENDLESPSYVNSRKCCRKTLSISQRGVTIAEQKNAVEKKLGQRKMDVCYYC